MAGRKSVPDWFRSIGRWFRDWLRRAWQWYLGWFRRIRWLYWHRSDEWFSLALQRYFKALILLVLWILAAIGLFLLLKRLLPDTLQIPLLGEKESIALLGSLLSALIGFGLQQWKGHEEEERRQREEETRVLCVIEEEFPDTLRSDLSEGARRYVAFRRKGGIWQRGRIRARLEEIWGREAPPELRCAIALIERFPEAKNFAPSEQADSLRWIYNYLDEDWRSRVADELLNLGGPFPEWTEEQWRTVLGIWPEVTLGKGLFASDLYIVQGLRYLGLSINPFGLERAEADPYLLKVRAIPSWWKNLTPLTAGLFFTMPGGGRTAAALLLAYDALKGRTAFPVYCRVVAAQLNLDDLARWTAHALARYIALSPRSFTKCPYSARQAMKRLLSGYLPTDPPLYFQEAGLPSIGEGEKVLKEFQSHLSSPSRPLPAQADLPTWLGEARPVDFPRTLILMDVQGVVESEDIILSLYALKDALARAGITLQVFLSASSTRNLQTYGESLEWSEGDMEVLLENRLRLLSPEETLDAWCDLRTGEVPSVEKRLIAAAGHNPRRLIRLGNALLRRIGETWRRLTPKDLDEVLGPA